MIELVGLNAYAAPSWGAPPIAHRPNTARSVESPTEFGLHRTSGDYQAESTFRAAKLESLRRQIAAGEFETQERIEGTVLRLLDVIA
jgi:hypothetical protein